MFECWNTLTGKIYKIEYFCIVLFWVYILIFSNGNLIHFNGKNAFVNEVLTIEAAGTKRLFKNNGYLIPSH